VWLELAAADRDALAVGWRRRWCRARHRHCLLPRVCELLAVPNGRAVLEQRLRMVRTRVLGHARLDRGGIVLGAAELHA